MCWFYRQYNRAHVRLSTLFLLVILMILEVHSVGSEKPLVHFVVDEELLKRVDEYRYKKRFPSRAAAMKWLMEWALKNDAPAPGEDTEKV